MVARVEGIEDSRVPSDAIQGEVGAAASVTAGLERDKRRSSPFLPQSLSSSTSLCRLLVLFATGDVTSGSLEGAVRVGVDSSAFFAC
jgi:hypothetical protein